MFLIKFIHFAGMEMDPRQKDEELKKLGARIADFRIARDLTQDGLAEKLNNQRQNISRLERGEINPSYIFLIRLCEELEITLHKLIKDL